MKRRDYIKLAAILGTGAAITLYVSLRAEEIEELFLRVVRGEKHVIWLQGSGDTGCTISLLQGVNPDLVDVINEFRLAVDFHPNLMVPSGDEATAILEKAADGTNPLDVFIVEGAIPEGNFCTVGEVNGVPIPVRRWVELLGRKAKYVAAVGTCASYGGISAASPNPTGCRSVSKVLHGKQVVNIPGCPPHPDWVTLTLATLLSEAFPALDEHNRPEVIFEEDIHDECPLKDFYEEDKFAQQPSEKGCLLKLGCRGPISKGDCPTRLWNNKTSFCTSGLWKDEVEIYPGGAPCIGCQEPGFPDPPFSPFYKPQPKRDGDEREREREGDED